MADAGPQGVAEGAGDALVARLKGRKKLQVLGLSDVANGPDCGHAQNGVPGTVSNRLEQQRAIGLDAPFADDAHGGDAGGKVIPGIRRSENRVKERRDLSVRNEVGRHSFRARRQGGRHALRGPLLGGGTQEVQREQARDGHDGIKASEFPEGQDRGSAEPGVTGRPGPYVPQMLDGIVAGAGVLLGVAGDGGERPGKALTDRCLFLQLQGDFVHVG